MKTKITLSFMALAVALIAGCSKTEESTPVENAAQPTAPAATPAANTSRTAPAAGLAQEDMNASAEAMRQKADEATAAAKEMAAETTQAVKETAAEVQNQFAEVVAEVKEYIAEEKYQEGLQTLQGLANLELTDEQQKIVDDLKVQLNKAMSSEAVRSLGGLLGGDK